MKRLVFKKKSGGGGRGSQIAGDAVITHTTHKTSRSGQLVIRIRQATLERCRMRYGDRVWAEIIDDGETGRMTLTRSDDDREAFKISAKPNDTAGVIKITIDKNAMGQLWPSGKTSPLVCTLVDGDSSKADFLFELKAGAASTSKEGKE